MTDEGEPVRSAFPAETFAPENQTVTNMKPLIVPWVSGWAVLLAAWLSPAAEARTISMMLVQDGQPRVSIVVAKASIGVATEPTPDKIWEAQPAANKVAAAAADLQTYLEKITGGKVPIVGDDAAPQGPLILVGRSALTEPFNARIPAGLTTKRAEEGYAVIAAADKLVLAGNDEGPYHGTEYAVASLLHRLGVRWYMPGPFGEVVPKSRSAAVPEGETVGRPGFVMRNWWGPQTTENRALEYRWKIRNGMNPVLHFVTLPSDSSVRSVLPKLDEKDPAKNKEAADLLGKKLDGTPNDGMPNLSNPKAVEYAANGIKEAFRKDPAATSWGIGADDGIPRDFTPESVKLNLGFPDVGGRAGLPAEASATEEWMRYINGIARAVHAEFPDKIITTNGYANRNTPPLGMTVEPNVWIMFAAIWSDTLHAYDNPRSWQTQRQGQMLQRWAALAPTYMYNYTYYMLASAGTPLPLSRKHAHDFPLLKKWGVIGFSDEGRTVLAESGIYPTYLRARLMWDPGLDATSLLEEYFASWYGPAAEPAKAFWFALEDAIESTPMLGHEDRILPYVYTPELMETLRKHLEAAEKLATDEWSKPRVRADRLIYEHLRGYLAMTTAEWAADFPEAVKQADFMLAQRKELAAISPFLMQPDDEKSTSGFYYWGLTQRRAYYQKLADLTTGKTGDLVVKLPEATRFRTDPRDEGRFAGWSAADFKDAGWKTLKTTMPFYAQGEGYRDEAGYPYMGAMWYRFDAEIPPAAKDRKVMLYVPSVETEAWVWVNGQFAGHKDYHEAYERPNEIELEVGKLLKPGEKNVVVLRVHTGFNAAQQSAGMTSRAFLYAPK